MAQHRSNWWLFAPLAMCVVLAGVAGLRLGSAWTSLDESDVIEHYTWVYLRDHAQSNAQGTPKQTDCVAFPAPEATIWLVVRCRPADGVDVWDFHVRPGGGLAYTGRDLASRPEV